MAAVPLFIRDTNMASVASRENTLYRKQMHRGLRLGPKGDTIHLENRSLLNFKHVTFIFVIIL